MTPEVRLSPDGTEIAVRWPSQKYWTIRGRETFEALVCDEQVADWVPLVPARHIERVTCPWCGRAGRALDERGRIRHHFGNVPGFYTARCAGAGQLPSEHDAATTAGAS